LASRREGEERSGAARMLELILSMPEEWERAVVEYENVDLPSRGAYSAPKSVVVVGMGGSAIAGDIVYDYLYDELSVPYAVFRDFSVPGWVRGDSLVVAVSYSGNTEETLRALKIARDRGAAIVLVTSDGLMMKLAEKHGLPVFGLPSGRPPRTAVAYMTAALLWTLDKSGVHEFPRASAAEAATALRDARREIMESDNLKNIAKALANKTLLIYSYRPYYSVGFRLKTQVNENAKSHAFWMPIPEANHNEIMGWEGGEKRDLAVVFVRGSEEPDYVSVRIEYWLTLLNSLGVPYFEIIARKRDRLSELLSLIFKADMLSYYLAIERGVDPLPVTTISGLKRFVEERTGFSKRFSELI